MMNCQAPRKPWRASQMTTFFITLLCFPSFLGASVCVTYTMWTWVNKSFTKCDSLLSCDLSLNFLLLSFTCSGMFLWYRIKPSDSCGPFRGLNTMFQAGKKWVEALAHDDPYLTWLAWVHTYLVENPFFLFLASGIFLWVMHSFPISFNKPQSK